MTPHTYTNAIPIPILACVAHAYFNGHPRDVRLSSKSKILSACHCLRLQALGSCQNSERETFNDVHLILESVSNPTRTTSCPPYFERGFPHADGAPTPAMRPQTTSQLGEKTRPSRTSDIHVGDVVLYDGPAAVGSCDGLRRRWGQSRGGACREINNAWVYVMRQFRGYMRTRHTTEYTTCSTHTRTHTGTLQVVYPPPTKAPACSDSECAWRARMGGWGGRRSTHLLHWGRTGLLACWPFGPDSWAVVLLLSLVQVLLHVLGQLQAIELAKVLKIDGSIVVPVHQAESCARRGGGVRVRQGPCPVRSAKLKDARSASDHTGRAARENHSPDRIVPGFVASNRCNRMRCQFHEWWGGGGPHPASRHPRSSSSRRYGCPRRS